MVRGEEAAGSCQHLLPPAFRRLQMTTTGSWVKCEFKAIAPCGGWRVGWGGLESQGADRPGPFLLENNKRQSGSVLEPLVAAGGELGGGC